MRNKILQTIIILLGVFVLFFAIYMKFYFDAKKMVNDKKYYNTECGKYDKGYVEIGINKILVDIADNTCKTTLGLSGKKLLKEGEGMMFIFEKPGRYGFWMKDMNFPIDMLWLSNDFKIIGIEKNVSPDTYPKSFGHDYTSTYILEVPANYSSKNNIKVNMKVIFSENL